MNGRFIASVLLANHPLDGGAAAVRLAFCVEHEVDRRVARLAGRFGQR